MKTREIRQSNFINKLEGNNMVTEIITSKYNQNIIISIIKRLKQEEEFIIEPIDTKNGKRY